MNVFFETASNGVTATPSITGTWPLMVEKNDCAPTATPPVAISGTLAASSWSAQLVPCCSVVVKQVSSLSGWPSTPPSSSLM